MKNKTWYLGLDVGSASVGWAATDSNYKLLRKNKNDYGERVYLKKQQQLQTGVCLGLDVDV